MPTWLTSEQIGRCALLWPPHCRRLKMGGVGIERWGRWGCGRGGEDDFGSLPAIARLLRPFSSSPPLGGGGRWRDSTVEAGAHRIRRGREEGGCAPHVSWERG
ncbi:hypothetical protein Cni_G01477 [Canna indica]|uniref:Uncharacterized protein n=1 Tax=Canna indica TaxID=4628 RepID=A0AAQ3Q113_9LILI|nr:hypothetical protein Cni_G01477 [Canna indica]